MFFFISTEEWDPTIEDSYRKQVRYKDTNYLLDILDTCGMEEYSALRDQWIRSQEYFIFAFACNSRNSIDRLTPLISQVSRVKDEPISNIPSIIIGTKYDLDEEFEFDTGELERLARETNSPLIFTSARYNINVEEAFLLIIKQFRKNQKRLEEQALQGGKS